MHTFNSLDEVRAALEVELGPSGPMLVEQGRIDGFAEVTGDDQWIHVDAERAATGPYGTTIAHGYLTLSLIPILAREVFDLPFARARVNYGLNKVRFPAPSLVGSVVRLRSTFIALTESGTTATLTIRHVVEVEHDPKPVCVAEALVLLT